MRAKREAAEQIARFCWGKSTTHSTSVNNVRTASGLNIIAGLWLVLAPFVLGYSNLQSAVWNDVVVGILVLLLAVWRVSKPYRTIGASWTNVGIGVWLIAAPFVLGYSAIENPMWNDIVVGIVIAILASWSAMAIPSAHRQRA